MSYQRRDAPTAAPTEEALTAALVGLGMRFGGTPNVHANVEDTLYHAAYEGMERSDLRTLSVVTQWIFEYHRFINVDRLRRLLVAVASKRVKAFFSACAKSIGELTRYRTIVALYRGPRVEVHPADAFLYARHGEDSRFVGTCLRVPANTLRIRAGDVRSVVDVVNQHPTLRFRALIGPSYRADAFAALERQPLLAAADVARAAYCCHRTAALARADYLMLYCHK